MKLFDSVLDVILGTPRERELEGQLADMTRERDDLRRHVQNIRIAHEPLQHAIYPPHAGG